MQIATTLSDKRPLREEVSDMYDPTKKGLEIKIIGLITT